MVQLDTFSESRNSMVDILLILLISLFVRDIDHCDDASDLLIHRIRTLQILSILFRYSRAEQSTFSDLRKFAELNEAPIDLLTILLHAWQSIVQQFMVLGDRL